MVVILVIVAVILVLVAPVPVSLLIVVVKLAEVAMRIMVRLDSPLLIVDTFVVVPIMIVAIVGIVDTVVPFGTTGGQQRQKQDSRQQKRSDVSFSTHVVLLSRLQTNSSL
jgi:hypothetical protein